MKTIHQGAFAYCSSLNEVNIGKNVSSIDYSTFCASGPSRSINTFTIDPENRYFDGDGLFVIDNSNTLTACFKVPSDGVIKIPSNVTAIGDHVFMAKPTITSVIAPAGLDLSSASIRSEATITYICTKPAAPTQTTFVYNGSEQTCMADAAANSGYTVSENKKTDAGSYTATVTLTAGSNPRYVWGDTSTMTEAASGATAVITYAWSIDKRDQLAPTGVTSAAIVAPAVTGSITGVDTTMEYGTDNANWTACTGTTINDLAPGVYYVRKAGNNNEYASPSVTVVVRRDGEHALTVNGGTGSGVHAENDQVEVSATAPTGMKFNGWTVTGADLGLSAEQLASPTLTVTMPNGDATLTASFVNATVTGVTLNRSSLPLAPGATAALTASYLPADVKPQYQGVTWSSNNESIATVDASGTVTAKAEGTATITVTATNGTASTADDKTATCAVTVARPQSAPSYSDSSDDDYTPSKTETTTNADGSTTKTTTNADGSKTAVTTKQDGSTVTVNTAKDGSAVTTEKTADGSTATVKTDKSGSVVSTEVNPSAKAIENAEKSGEPVTLPVEVKATGDAASAPEVQITLPKGETGVRVEIPVENLTSGTVAVIVKPDGTEEIVKTSVTGKNGVVLTLEESATVKLVDNIKSFSDVHAGDWFAPYVAWAASRGIMNGMGDGTFAPNATASRAQIAQMLFNLDGAKANGGLAAFADVNAGDWYAGAVTWMVENGIAQGTGESFGADSPISREQLAVMLYHYAQYKGYDVSASGDVSAFPDKDSVNGYAQTALTWAVGAGLISGSTDEHGNVVLAPQGSATRGQIAAIIERFCENVAK